MMLLSEYSINAGNSPKISLWYNRHSMSDHVTPTKLKQENLQVLIELSRLHPDKKISYNLRDEVISIVPFERCPICKYEFQFTDGTQ